MLLHAALESRGPHGGALPELVLSVCLLAHPGLKQDET
jgi:hypothetical protein